MGPANNGLIVRTNVHYNISDNFERKVKISQSLTVNVIDISFN